MVVRYFENLARALLGLSYNQLNTTQQKVITSIAEQTSVSEDVNQSFTEGLTFGQRVADRMASFGGSWTFIILFVATIATWILFNTLWLAGGDIFDPYPFILLNLALSTLAAFQAPIIMMSQNRQAAKDRLKQEATFAINLKLELELQRVNDKLDFLLKDKKYSEEENWEL